MCTEKGETSAREGGSLKDEGERLRQTRVAQAISMCSVQKKERRESSAREGGSLRDVREADGDRQTRVAQAIGLLTEKGEKNFSEGGREPEG